MELAIALVPVVIGAVAYLSWNLRRRWACATVDRRESEGP